MNSRARASLEPSLQNGGVGVNAAVAQEGPVAANILDAARVALDHKDFFLVGGGLGEHLPEWIGHEGMPPEFKTVLRSALESDAIDSGDKNPVGDGMRALDGAPS